MVLTDVLKRYQVLKGRPSILSTGTDEHGMKIQQAADAASTHPKEFCDEVSQKFRILAASADLSADHFIRTTDTHHKEAVQYFWHELNARGWIYESKHQGWYCVSDETYYPSTTIEKRLDPVTGRTFMASQETGKEVQWTSETNYHFKLSAFRDRLLFHYKQNSSFIVPESRMKEVSGWLEAGLDDLSISRPSSRLTWGIPVPSDPSQTIYVWLDALVNYATTAAYPSPSFFSGAAGWPADVHVIGKDIMRFHCIYWPAFLMALDLPLPRQILTHAHWTMNGGKMSKSVGNVVSPALAMQRYGVDPMRFYLIHDGGIADDADYSNDFIEERYRKALAGGIGNLAQRLLKPKAWDVRECVAAATSSGSQPPSYPGSTIFRTMLTEARSRVDTHFTALNPRAALHAVMDVVYTTNKHLQACEPWNLVKTGSARDEAVVKAVVYDCIEAVRISGILLQPFMPSKSEQLLDMLGVEGGGRVLEMATYGMDDSYGVAKEGEGAGKGRGRSLFPPLV